MFDDSAYKNKPGFIYLIHAVGSDRYKIGLTTRSVQARLVELNSSQSPYPLELIDWFETDNVTEDEKYFHEKYSAHRVHGEWFVFDKRTLKEVRREYQDDVGFTFPQLPRISLPTLSKLPAINRNNIALAIASIGALWLIVAMSGYLPKTTPNNSTPRPPQKSLLSMAHE
ncbi:MAG: GIY-YIG nuclease family protein [Symploca sp. SIO1B1]|nr:GIY-YIG nuclease family protein [Symploca sp. SIO1B1]